MKKIYFADTPWSNSKTLVENFRHQTPDNSGTWENITFTLNKDEADYIIIMDETSESVVEEKVIFLGREPSAVGLKEWTKNSFGNYHHEKGNSWFAQTWWIKIPFDELITLNPKKEKNLSSIDSGKRYTQYHNFRVDLNLFLRDNFKSEIDVFGPINNKVLPYRDKTNGLHPYRYSLVLENCKTDFYFSEKIADPILMLTLPIYSGCKQIEKFLPKGSYISFDDSKGVEYAAEQIIEISKSNFREDNIENLKEARELMMKKYNIWPTIHKAINEGKLL
jgi:hypothetical protein